MTLIKICSEKGRFSQSGGSFFKIFPGTLDPTMVGPPTSLNIWHLHFFKRFDGPVCRSSRSQMFFKIDVLKNFAIFIGKHLCWSLFLIAFFNNS